MNFSSRNFCISVLPVLLLPASLLAAYPNPAVSNPVPIPTNPVPIPTSTTSPISEEKLQQYANQQARTVANRIAATFGQLENWRYNFVVGFWQNFSDYSYGTISPSDPSYRQGMDEGNTAGYAEGKGAGAVAGDTQATANADQEVRQRFMAVVDQPALSPDVQVHVPQIEFEGLNGKLSAPGLDAGLPELSAAFQNELSLLSWQDHGFVVGFDQFGITWSLAEVYRYGSAGGYAFADQWFQSDFAYVQWRQNGLGGNFDLNIWNKLGPEQQARFEQYFKTDFRRAIEEKYYRIRTAYNGSALNRGASYGTRAGRKYAYLKGYYDGYLTSYHDGSIDGFDQQFARSYEGRFLSQVDFYNQNPVLEVTEAQLTDANGALDFEINGSLAIRVMKAVNLGRKPAESGAVTLVGGDFLKPGTQLVTFSLARSSSLAQPVLLKGMGWITPQISADTTYDLKAGIAGANVGLKLTLSWSSVIERFAAASSEGQEFRALAEFLVDDLHREWTEAIDSGENSYKHRVKPDGHINKLVQVVEFYGVAPEGRRKNIRSQYDRIMDIQDDHGFWHPFIRSSFRKLANQLK